MPNSRAAAQLVSFLENLTFTSPLDNGMLLIHTKICPVIYSLRHVLLKDRKKTPQECSPKLAPPFETLQKRSSCKKKNEEGS